MLQPLLLLAVAAPPQEPAPKTPRSAVIELLEAAQQPAVHEVELRHYEVDFGCELAHVLLGHLERHDATHEEALLDAVDLLQESADVEITEAPVRELADLRSRRRIWDAGGRRLVETLDDVGGTLRATLIAGDRRAHFDAERDALQLGPLSTGAHLEASAEDLLPIPSTGPWFTALARTDWTPLEPGSAFVAAMDRGGRRLDMTFDFVEESNSRPVRAVATYYGVRETSAEAVLLAWDESDGQPYLAETLRITLHGDGLRLRHARRGAPRLGLAEKQIQLTIPRPAAVEIASSQRWRSFRRREAVPRAWSDLVQIER